MTDGPNIVSIAALVGDQARASMLLAMMSGEALTATELATEASISKQTASSHLSKLFDAGLITLESQGRHRYFTLADPDVADLLEKLLGIADRTGARRLLPGPKEPALRKARICYDHLAGEMGVIAYDYLLSNKYILETRQKATVKPGHGPVSDVDSDTNTLKHAKVNARTVSLSKSGKQFLEDLGLKPDTLKSARRPQCRACLDWSVRRHHLAGTVGAMLLQHCFDQKWAKRLDNSRVIHFNAKGEKAFLKVFEPALSTV